MENGIKDLFADIKTHLEYQKMMGNAEIPKSEIRNPKQISNSKSQITNKDTNELEAIRAEIGDCNICKLGKGRTKLVFGVGNPNAELMFVGEGPGYDEDQQGEPFVGRAGQLLTKIIIAMGLKREDVYITNVVMCRPPNNRNPEPDEIETCMPFLMKRIAVIKPKMVVCLGAVAAKALLNTEVPISKMRGKLIDWNGIKVMPTYHPAFLLRNPAMKRPVWEDMQKVMEELKKI